MQFVNEQEGPSNKEEVNKKTYLMSRWDLSNVVQFNIFPSSKLQRAEGHLLQVTFFGSNYDNF